MASMLGQIHCVYSALQKKERKDSQRTIKTMSWSNLLSSAFF